MGLVYVRCRGKGCSHRFAVECRETDQVLVCPKCNEFSTFVNLGVFQCRGCDHLQKVPLTMRPHSGRCERCGQETSPFRLNSPDSELHYWPLEHHELLEGNYLIQGCRRATFSESEGEIEIAKESLERAYRAGWFAFRNNASTPRAMFIRQTGLACIPGDRSIPCAFRSYHGYCNFPWYKGDEYTAKFSGTLAGFATGWPFQVAVDENDCEDIWLGGKDLLAELSRFPTLVKYKQRFKVI